MEGINSQGFEKARHVKGSLFKEYVRMIKKNKRIDWSKYLSPSDMNFIKHGIITVVEWYPYETLQNLGDAIFHEIAGEDTEVARSWGRKTMEGLADLYRKNLIEKGDQFQTLKKFINMYKHFFDFGGFELIVREENHVEIKVDQAFGEKGAKGYGYQMIGSFERLIELSGADEVKAKFLKKAWEGARNTVIELRWSDGNGGELGP